MRNCFFSLLAVIAIQLASGTTAFGQNWGGHGHHNYLHPQSSFGYGRQYPAVQSPNIWAGGGYGGYGGANYNPQSRGHYDYHPSSVQRHWFHYDVVPGHYDYHR